MTSSTFIAALFLEYYGTIQLFTHFFTTFPGNNTHYVSRRLFLATNFPALRAGEGSQLRPSGVYHDGAGGRRRGTHRRLLSTEWIESRGVVQVLIALMKTTYDRFKPMDTQVFFVRENQRKYRGAFLLVVEPCVGGKWD